jgi:hypothetical protein
MFPKENMANLDRIQQLLNTNEDYQKRFLQDPVAALAHEGLQLSLEMQQDIRQQVRKAGVKGALKKEYIKIQLTVVLVSSV